MLPGYRRYGFSLSDLTMNIQHNATVSRQLARSISELREAFASFVDAFNALSARRRDFAVPFMGVFDRWHQETGLSFVAFVRELDPSMPVARDEYPNHRSFQAALYLRRIAEAPHTVAGADRKSSTPLQMLARVVRTVAPLSKAGEDALVSAIVSSGGWHQRDSDRLRRRVSRARHIPQLRLLFQPAAPRLVRHSGGRRETLAVAADRTAAAS